MTSMKVLLATAYLASQIEAAPYVSGQVTSVKSHLYGKFVCRMRSPDMKGSTMGFFTQWTGPNWFYGGWRSIEHEIVPSMTDAPLSMDLSWSDGTNRL